MLCRLLMPLSWLDQVLLQLMEVHSLKLRQLLWQHGLWPRVLSPLLEAISLMHWPVGILKT